jgi:hypothetical protein
LFGIRYHIPRSFLKPKDNLLVILEEEAVSPEKVAILNVNRDTVCSLITENHPPNIKEFSSKNKVFQPSSANLMPEAIIKCPNHKTISAVEFASFGDPTGFCGGFIMGKCHAPASKKIVEQVNKPKTTYDEQHVFHMLMLFVLSITCFVT